MMTWGFLGLLALCVVFGCWEVWGSKPVVEQDEPEDLGEVRSSGIRFKVVKLYLWDGSLCIHCVSERGDFVMGGHSIWSLFGPDGKLVATFRQDFPDAASKDGTVTLLLSVHISEVGAW